ncbi:MAG: 23S rRNA (adenine(2503)-C(2))-methyltransferase RlmN [Clostridiales bacterium]|nr:23S rRNA (adenine(2503)-C(2))-methyltransferase RlmN [Clostridiales bacterium]
MTDISSMTEQELIDLLGEKGEKPYRAKQIFSWLHNRMAGAFEEMTDLPKSLREQLAAEYRISSSPRVVKSSGLNKTLKIKTLSDTTCKYLFQIDNNIIIESVYMNYHFGGSVCVSTQAGCRMDCAFCASGTGGLTRNLTAGEMCGQVYSIKKQLGEGPGDCPPRGDVSRVTLMGSGEPLDNLPNVLRFIGLITSEHGQNIGSRHITLSTCGLIPQIKELAELRLQITLAVSLHAPNDEIRRRIMPVARSGSIEELVTVCKQYADRTKRRVTFEYALIKGLNDSATCARQLGKLLRGGLIHVNLIPINRVKEHRFYPSGKEAINKFTEILREQNIETTIRRTLGGGVDAACGQLKNSFV